ncbi:conserved hypothetical protein [Ekhidna lutea]|uniref:Uncharacterized protein n=1 Tax=Ekhidna lutea TaxID=447679 RepID=A0A239J9J9_EKHLU|nr:SgcJ/EcaC family oxidoreductase [Ekhidna lutea]SNT01324.1 conserved hypothetical protein [Ekhidna lutea]
MKKVLTFTLILIALSTYSQDGNREQISNAINTMVEGWKAGNGELFASPFTDDATFKTWFGLEINGKEAIAEGHNFIFKYFYANTVWNLKVDKIRFLTDDFALAYCSGAIFKMGATEKTEPDCVPLAVFQRIDEQWKIVSFQNTLYAVGEGGKSPGDAGVAKQAIWEKVGSR